ncbi:amino acid/polyamine transporter I [Fennellomyces sp. T-0311]|nr:amino acid/polyamine transporter I [Fennellomyces sp. T-0311]
MDTKAEIDSPSKSSFEKSTFEESSTASSASDRDANRLKQLGYKQEFKREVSLLVQTGFALASMSPLPNWLLGFGGSIAAGGPMSLFWGILVLLPFLLCSALAMAEIFSAYPVNGGVYSWSYLLSSPKWGPLLSWVCGYVMLGGLLAAQMTVGYSVSQYTFSIQNILHPENAITSKGAYIGLTVAYLLASSAYCCLGIKASAYMTKFLVFMAVAGTFIIVIGMPVMAPTHPSAKWVFTEFQNTTGYENSGLVFFFGLLQAGWTLLCYENGAHISEGTKNAEVTGPRGILISVITAAAQCIVLCVATLFSIQDLEEIQNSSEPVATLFLRATNESVAAFFLVILLVSQFGTLTTLTMAAGQLLWSMARDKCIPNYKFWYKLTGKNKAPLRILTINCLVCIIFMLPSLGSEAYWGAMMSTTVICMNTAYLIPFACRLIWHRNDMPKGPFNLGKFSVPITILAVLWIIFFGIILCIPTINPVSPETMNWASLMIGGIIILALFFWVIGGRNYYKGPMHTAEDTSSASSTKE